jgi:hypothetical protein
MQGCGCGNLRERGYFEDLGINGKVNLKWIFKHKNGGLCWIDTVEDSGRWRDVVNEVMDLEVIDLEVMDLEAMDLEVMDLEIMDLEVMDLEIMDFEVMDLEVMDLEVMDLEVIDLEVPGKFLTH